MELGDVTTIFENFTIQNSLIVIQHSNNLLRDLRATFVFLAVKQKNFPILNPYYQNVKKNTQKKNKKRL
jgi:hypothetical protein